MDQRRLLHWCGDAWKEHLSFMFVSVLLWSGIYSGLCTGTQVTHVSPAVLAWEAFRKVTLIAPQVASEASKVLMVKSWTSVRDPIRSTPGSSPPCLSGRTGRGECDTCEVCLHPHVEQGGTPSVERWPWSLFFSRTDGS